jgi:hypothetical protein
MYVLNQIKKHIVTSKLLEYLKTFRTKKVLKIFLFFLYSVQGAWCGSWRKFLADRRIFKHCLKSAKMSIGPPLCRP